MKAPRLYIYVEGGIIQSIVSDQKVEVLVADVDVNGDDRGDENVRAFKDHKDGSEFLALIAWNNAETEIDKKVVDHYYSQLD